MDYNFKFILTVRFIGYLLLVSGTTGIILFLGPIIKVEFDYRYDLLFNIKHTIPVVITSQKIEQEKNGILLQEASSESSFSTLQSSSDSIVPLSTEFGIVIEKINANAKIVANVDASNEKEYTRALQTGVAQALGSTPPGEKGNLYLFSHSTNAPWNIVRYNAIFYLLRELEIGDRVIVFYQNRRYDYIVFDKSVVASSDVSFLTYKYDEPVLTLQTCDPPGTLLRRLIVRARLVKY